MRNWRLTFIGLGAVVVALAPILAFHYLVHRPAIDPVLRVPHQHFSIVSVASLLAGLIAVAIGFAGRRQRNIEVTFLALAFMSLALLFSIHGLSTPGFLLPATKLPGIAAQVSIFVTAVWFGLSSLSSDSPAVVYLSRWQGVLLPLWALILTAVGTVSLVRPALGNLVPVNSPPLVWPMAIVTMTILLVATIRYWRSYTYSRFPLQLAIVYAGGWLTAAQWIMINGTVWRLSWWLYHFLFVAATVALIVGILLQYAQGTSLVSAARGLFLTDPVERLNAGLSNSVHALIVATEARDPYTAGHAYRVTLSAVRLGEAMGLSGEMLRALAQGGVMHDVGKIEVPDLILNKPGSLSPEERRIVERHPVTGYTMCKRLGFMRDELDVIRHHHERWDGMGYPDRLAGDHIPLLARVLAIADVYDAVTSARSYRGPWSHEQARVYIIEQAGRQFDPHCVEVWSKLTAGGPIREATLTRLTQARRPA